MSALVTGATGFIGSELVARLIEHDINVYGLVRHSPRIATNIPRGVVVLTGDLLDYHSLKKAVRVSQPEYIFHLAAMTPVRMSFNNPFIYEEINYRGTMNMVHAALATPTLTRFIHASTMEVYKHKDSPIVEDDPLYGSTPYGVSKVAADYYVRVAGDCYGLPYTILRPCNSYGRKTERGYLVEKVVTTMLNSDSLILDGSKDSVRSLMYVSDHVDAYLACLSRNGENEVFNIGTGVGVSVEELVDLCRELLDWKGKVGYEGKPRPFEADRLVLNADKARKLLGWTAKVCLKDGVMETINYWKVKRF